MMNIQKYFYETVVVVVMMCFAFISGCQYKAAKVNSEIKDATIQVQAKDIAKHEKSDVIVAAVAEKQVDDSIKATEKTKVIAKQIIVYRDKPEAQYMIDPDFVLIHDRIVTGDAGLVGKKIAIKPSDMLTVIESNYTAYHSCYLKLQDAEKFYNDQRENNQ